MFYKVFLVVLLIFVFPLPILAAEPMDYTLAQTYTFEIIDYSDAGAEQLDIDLSSPGFINNAGSVGSTLVYLVSEHSALSLLTIFIIIFLGLVFVFAFVANKKMDGEISSLTTEIDLNESLEKMTKDPAALTSIRQRRRDITSRRDTLQRQRTGFGGAARDFRRLNSGRGRR